MTLHCPSDCQPLARKYRTQTYRHRLAASLLLDKLLSSSLHHLTAGYATHLTFESRINALLCPADQDPKAKPPFGLPTPYATRTLGDGLHFQLPITRLKQRLHDWVHSSDDVYHTTKYFICLCNWQPLLFDARKTRTMQEAIALYKAGLDFKKADTYQEDKTQLEKGRPLRRNKIVIDSQPLLDAYYQRFVSMFESIGKHGLLSLDEAQEREPELAGASTHRRWQTSYGEKDIGIAVGPNGEIVVLPGAKHRLAISSVLGISSVPVQVRMIHAQWLVKLDKPAQKTWREAIRQGLSVTVGEYHEPVKENA